MRAFALVPIPIRVPPLEPHTPACPHQPAGDLQFTQPKEGSAQSFFQSEAVYLFPCQKHGMKRSPVCTNPTVFPVANSHFLSSIQGIVAQKAGGDRQTLDSMMGKEFPIASFTLYSLTRFLGASPKFCKAEFLLASSKVLNNISGF